MHQTYPVTGKHDGVGSRTFREVLSTFLHRRLTRPATALLVAAVSVTLFALPATSASTGSPGVASVLG